MSTIIIVVVVVVVVIITDCSIYGYMNKWHVDMSQYLIL